MREEGKKYRKITVEQCVERSFLSFVITKGRCGAQVANGMGGGKGVGLCAGQIPHISIALPSGAKRGGKEG